MTHRVTACATTPKQKITCCDVCLSHRQMPPPKIHSVNLQCLALHSANICDSPSKSHSAFQHPTLSRQPQNFQVQHGLAGEQASWCQPPAATSHQPPATGHHQLQHHSRGLCEQLQHSEVIGSPLHIDSVPLPNTNTPPCKSPSTGYMAWHSCR